MFELEKTYLAKYLPKGFENSPSREIIDLYFPQSSEHPKLRLRKKGSKIELTKKQPVNNGDASHQIEQNINLNDDEYKALSKLPGKVVQKIRYEYSYNGQIAEIDVFTGSLKGLVVVDFEFDSLEDKDSFTMPEFCLADVTQELFIAGGMLCGKSYQDIESDLNKFAYKKLI